MGNYCPKIDNLFIMKEEIIKLSELGNLLGYSDTRSIETWCKKNGIPIIPAGKVKYVLASFIEQYFKDSLTNEISRQNKVPRNDNGIDRLSVIKQIQTHSKASQSFLNNIKS